MTTVTENTNNGLSGWQRLVLWQKSFDETTDYHPADRALARQNRNVSELEDAVRHLETRLETEKRCTR